MDPERRYGHTLPPNSNRKTSIYIAISGILIVLFVILLAAPRTRIKNGSTRHDIPPQAENNEIAPAEGIFGDWEKSVVLILVSAEDLNNDTGKSGTGFIISKDGNIITNYHVISGGSRIEVVLDNKDLFEASVEEVDAELDVAIIHINPKHALMPLQLARDVAGAGRKIVVMGYPLAAQLGTQISITEGLISSVRSNSTAIEWYQISAAVNPGNSGGPLIDAQSGEVLGIVTANIPEAQSIGFARPICTIKNHINLK